MLKYFCGAPLKIYLHEYLTHEYFHTRKFPDLRYWYFDILKYIILSWYPSNSHRKFTHLAILIAVLDINLVVINPKWLNFSLANHPA